MSEQRRRYLVTSALPYANGPLHVGQISGAYLPADAFVRYLRARGEDVVYVCGTDEHGVPITLTAEREGKYPQEVVDYWWAHMKETFERFSISFDNFSRTSTELHARNTQLFYRKLKEGGYISEAESKQMYSPTEGRFLPDRYVEGTCPVCGYKEARGDQCDNCGSWYEAYELIEPHSKVTGGAVEVRETTHLYLDLPEVLGAAQGVRRGAGALAHLGQELHPGHHRRGVGEAPDHTRHPVGRARSGAWLRGQALLRLVRRLHRLRLLDDGVGREHRGA